MRQPSQVGNSSPHTRGTSSAHSPPLQSGTAASERWALQPGHNRHNALSHLGDGLPSSSPPHRPPPASTIRFFFAPSAVLTSVPGPTLPRGLQTVPGPGWPSPSFCRNCSYPPSPSASTLAGRSSSDALRAILATYPRPGRLGLGQHLPSPEPHPGWFPPLRPTLANPSLRPWSTTHYRSSRTPNHSYHH